MIEYKECQTSELIALIRTLDDGAFSELVSRYTPMLGRVVSGFVNRNILYDEAFSEACVALHRAAMSYDIGRSEVTFGLYAQICVYRRLCDLAARESKGVEISDTDVNLLYTQPNIESRLVGRERMREYLKKARTLLSEYEYRIFLCYVNGESTAEIARKLGKSSKSVENAKSRMLKKLREGSNIFADD